MHRPIVFAFALFLVAGCTRDNPKFCEIESDCAVGFTCQMLSHECVADGSDAGDGGTCEMSMDCPAGAPVCSEDKVCAACTEGPMGDQVCGMRGDGLSRCADGACVACIDDRDCGVEAPVCDDNACRPCERHDECPSLVCNAGQCAAEAAVIYVDADAIDGDVSTCGSRTEPCETISGAAGALAKVETARSFVRLLVAEEPYRENISVVDEAVTVIGPGIEILPIDDQQPTLVEVRGGADLTLDGVTLTGIAGQSDDISRVIDCESDSSITLRGVTVTDNGDNMPVRGVVSIDCDVLVADSTVSDQTGVGINVRGGRLEVVRSLIQRNRIGGITITDASFRLVNNVIAENGVNGDALSQFGGVEIENAVDPGEQILAHNTIVSNRATDSAQASGVICLVPQGSATAVNNIVYFGIGAENQSVAGTCTWETSVIENGAGVGTDILTDDPLLVGRESGQFELMAGSPCIDSGQPVNGVTTDRAGLVRDANPDIGAHEFGGE